VLLGFLASSDPDGKVCRDLIDDSLKAIKADLVRAEKERVAAGYTGAITLGNVPRIARRSHLIRRLTLTDGHLGKALAMEKLLLKAFPEDKNLLSGISRTWDSWGYNRRARDLVKAFPENPGMSEAGKILGVNGDDGLGQVFKLILKADQEGARKRLEDIAKASRPRWFSGQFDSVFATAKCLKDSALMERLAREAISKTPKSRKLFQCVQMLTRVLPLLDQKHRERFMAYVKTTIESQNSLAADGINYNYYQRLKELIDVDIKLPITTVQPQVDKLLARGGYSNRYIPKLFSVLNQEDYQVLLRETYRKAKSSDRLTIIFSLICQYPGKMNAAQEALFFELTAEAVRYCKEDTLKIYRTNANSSYKDGTYTNTSAEFKSRLLDKFAKAESKSSQIGFLVEQIRVWNRAGDTERGLDAASKAFSLALKEQKTFSDTLALFEEFPAVYFESFLTILDRMEKENGQSVDIEKKRIALARQARNPDRLLSVLHESIRKFPKELTFYKEIRKELENQGRYYEVIEILESLAELESDNRQHRFDLQATWNRLAHPIKASAAVNKVYTPKPKPNVRKKAVKPVSPTVASHSVSSPRPSKPARIVKTAGGGNKEKPMKPTSTELIKKLYEAGEIDEASLRLRDLWRRFSALDQASRSLYFRRPGGAHSRYYEWPVQKSNPAQKTKVPVSLDSALGGLKAFLAMEPLACPYFRRVNLTGPSLFSVIGSEGFVAEELATWLRTFEPQEYKAGLFQELIDGIVKHRVSEQGVEPFINDLIARYDRGELSTLDQYALLAALELHPEAGGKAADLFLSKLIETLNPSDLWKMLRMARCFVKRGNEQAAISLYSWCGANGRSSRSYSYNNATVSGEFLVKEIRSNLDGDSRIRALDAALPLISPYSYNSSYQCDHYHFVLSAWEKELPVHQVYRHCPEVCRQMIGNYTEMKSRHPGSTVRATLYLASGGSIEEALNGFQLILDFWGSQPKTKSRYTKRISLDYLLQRLLPEDMTNWTNADRWLSGIVERVLKWQADRKLLTADAVKIMSLVAIRQHQNNFEDSAQTTLTKIGKLSLTNPNAAIWFIDAAEITGNQTLARQVATTLLKQRRLPIVRVASLMEMVAKQQGVPAAVQLAEKTLEYTWKPEFLQTMTKICTAAGDLEQAQLWLDRYHQIINSDSTPAAADDEKAEEDYRQLRKTSEAKEHVKALELGEAFLVAYPDHPKIATALYLAAKAGAASMNFKRTVPLFRRILKDHPDYDAIDEVRLKLVESLSGMRAFDECITQCRENLKAAPESPLADYWHFLIPHSQFRLWRFKEAEKGMKDFLASYPGSTYAEHARRYLQKINPSWKVDESGIGEYSGKYNEDYRFKAALAALPGYIKEGRQKIRQRLGVDIDFENKVNFIFRDAGPNKQGGLIAQTFIISRDYKPVTVIQFYAEHVVIDSEGYHRTVIHEMKHAGFKRLMGTSYDDLPVWIKEGLAQWVAEQLEGRIVSNLISETFSGKDPVSQMNGVANPAHDVGDYLEDVLAFEWLEKQKKENVIAFSQGLVKGESWQKLLADTSGLDADEAIRRMDSYCRERVAAELGPAGRQALALRDTFYAKSFEGTEALNMWLREEGNRLFAEWVDEHPGHVLETVLRFYSGRGLILTGQFSQGRQWLRSIIDAKDGSRLCDDALFLEGYSFQQEKRPADAARSLGVLLRDYSRSNSAHKVRGKFKPLGPELDPSSQTKGTNP